MENLFRSSIEPPLYLSPPKFNKNYNSGISPRIRCSNRKRKQGKEGVIFVDKSSPKRGERGKGGGGTERKGKGEKGGGGRRRRRIEERGKEGKERRSRGEERRKEE